MQVFLDMTDVSDTVMLFHEQLVFTSIIYYTRPVGSEDLSVV